jgi:NCS1 family nucleobase:cation symporter-1
LNLTALYQPDGEYRYTGGFSGVALTALAAGVLPNLPGFLVHVQAVSEDRVPKALADLYHYAWFVGLAVAFVVYLTGRKLARAKPR